MSMRAAATLVALSYAAQALGLHFPTSSKGSSTHRLPWQRTPCQRLPHTRLCASEEVDWREMRARLVAQEKASSAQLPDASAPAPASGWVYESPLIEQGTILLGGTKMDFGFALRQQFFHKSVMLLLQHDATFTKGIILNRPSALEVDGWRAWCGHGQVAEGGLFVGAERAMGQLEISALHTLEGAVADRVSTRVIKGVSYTSLDGAKALVAAGVAQKSDFWVCVGYSGWAPGQLQMEVEQRDSWYLASADSGTLLKELLREARGLPPPGDTAISADPGIDTWSNLMKGIGREADAVQSKGSLADRMLEQWVRAHLLTKPILPKPAAPPPDIRVGTVLVTMSKDTGLPADRFLLHEQFLLKAVLLVLAEDKSGDKLTACILNRPTANLARFNLPGDPTRRVAFCGDRALGGQLWLHHRPELGGVAVGDSRVFSLPVDTASELLKTGRAAPDDFLFVGAAVQFGRTELEGMVAAGEVRCVPPGKQLSGVWPRAWSLTKDDGGDEVGDGTEVWWLASQCGAEEQLAAVTSSDLADEALEEWLKFYVRSG